MSITEKKIFSTLFFSIFAAVTGVGIVVPLLPIYAHSLGASGFYIGLIFGAFSLSRSLFLPYFGKLSDRKGRKPLITGGLFAYVLVSVAFIFSKSVESLIVIRLFHGIASAMMMPVIQAYVGDITPAGKEGLSMGIFNMSMFMGLSFGPLIGGALKDRYNLQAAFICMGALTLVGFFLSSALLPPTRTERAVSRASAPRTFKTLIGDPYIAGLFVFRFAYAACIGIIWGFIPVFADSEFSLSSSAIGVLVTIGVFVSGIIHLPMGYLADRLNRIRMVAGGGLLIALSVGSFTWSQGFWSMLSASVFFGIGGGIATPALMALGVFEGGQTASMGSVMALLTLAHSLGMLGGSLLGGIMMDLFQLRQVFLLGMGLMLGGMAAFLLLTRSRRTGVVKIIPKKA